jgi:hypothetical protein
MTLETKLSQQYRSQGERQVAQFLNQLRISFQYEPDIYLKEGQKRYIWHPDFYLLEYRTIVEYLGVTGNQTYDEMAERKQRVYTANNYHFIGLRPADMTKDYQTQIAKSIDNHLYGNLRRYRQTTSSYRHK